MIEGYKYSITTTTTTTTTTTIHIKRNSDCNGNEKDNSEKQQGE